MTLVAEGIGRVLDTFDVLMKRGEDVAPMWEAAFHVLEDAEKTVFSELGGRYVDTGATMDSLTGGGGEGLAYGDDTVGHAIRAIHGFEAVFGTNVWYAHFLTQTVLPGEGPGSRPLPMAIMADPDKEAPVIAEAMLAVIMEGTL